MENQRKVKFHIPDNLIVENLSCSPLLYPFWGNSLNSNSFNFNVFKDYNFDSSYYELVENIKQADFVLIPYRYNILRNKHEDLFLKYIDFAKENKKPVFIDGTGDLEYKISNKDVYTLRIGGYASNKSENNINMAFYADDLLERNFGGKLIIRKKDLLPTIGFAGWAHLSLYQRIRTGIKELPIRVLSLANSNYKTHKKGVFFRIKVIKLLQKSKLIKTNFIIRGSYSGNVKTAEGNIEKIRLDFVNNLLESDYALVVRGDANSSVRLYEAISMGRIPLILNTDMIFPMDDVINYREFSVIVDFKDLKNIDRILSDFHDNLTDKEFQEMQQKARNAFANHLRVDKFTPYLMEKLLNISNNYE